MMSATAFGLLLLLYWCMSVSLAVGAIPRLARSGFGAVPRLVAVLATHKAINFVALMVPLCFTLA